MFAQTKFPNMLKMSDISPIFKGCDPKIPKNFWPIPELHNISKVFERAILNRITDYCTKNNPVSYTHLTLPTTPYV